MPDVSAGSKSRLGSETPLEVIVNKGGRWAHRVLIALEEAKLEYTVKEIDLAHKPDWFLKFNPAGLVPVLAVGQPPIYLRESADIVDFIVQSTPNLQPINEIKRAESVSFVQTALRLLQPELLPIVGKPPLSEAEQQVHHLKQLEAITQVQDLLHPTEGPFFTGAELKSADILLAPFIGRLWFYGKHGIAPAGSKTFHSLENDPKFERFASYVKAIINRPSFVRTWDEDYSIGKLKEKLAVYAQSQSSTAPKYPRFLPEPFDPKEVFEPQAPFNHEDRGLKADPTFPDLLHSGAVVDHLTPVVGTELKGVQLASLNDAAKDQLALFVAQRGVVVFRDQNFADLDPQKQLDFVKYFGPHYLHPSDRHPKDLPQYYSIFQDSNDRSVNNTVNVIENKLTSITWHTDGSSELQPPGLTLLFVLETPRNGGGDTLYTSTTEAYERLSPEFRQRLDGLQAEHYLPYNPSRREAPRNVHPVVRTHPVTGKKILFVNEVITRKIIGYRKEESDNLINFLTGHIARGQDFACRVKWEPGTVVIWEPGTVVIWDNRSTQHTATTNFPSDERRHLCRITSIAERPT